MGLSIQGAADWIRAEFQKALGSLDGWPYNPTFFQDPILTVSFSLPGVKVLVYIEDVTTGTYVWSTGGQPIVSPFPTITLKNLIPTIVPPAPLKLTAKGTYVTSKNYLVGVRYWTPGNVENDGVSQTFAGSQLKAGVALNQVFDLLPTGTVTASLVDGDGTPVTSTYQGTVSAVPVGGNVQSGDILAEWSGSTPGDSNHPLTFSSPIDPTDEYQVSAVFQTANGPVQYADDTIHGSALGGGFSIDASTVTTTGPGGVVTTIQVEVSILINGSSPANFPKWLPITVGVAIINGANQPGKTYWDSGPVSTDASTDPTSSAYVATFSIPTASISALPPDQSIGLSVSVNADDQQGWDDDTITTVSQLLSAKKISITQNIPGSPGVGFS